MPLRVDRIRKLLTLPRPFRWLAVVAFPHPPPRGRNQQRRSQCPQNSQAVNTSIGLEDSRRWEVFAPHWMQAYKIRSCFPAWCQLGWPRPPVLTTGCITNSMVRHDHQRSITIIPQILTSLTGVRRRIDHFCMGRNCWKLAPSWLWLALSAYNDRHRSSDIPQSLVYIK